MPVGKVRTIPLYDESYRLITAPDSQFGDRDQVTWKEVGEVPLCLLTPDMQNRRIIDRALLEAGTEAKPSLTSNSIIVLYTHVKTGRWASVMPAKLADSKWSLVRSTVKPNSSARYGSPFMSQ